MGHGPSQEVLEEQQHKRGHQLYISLVEATQEDCRSTNNGCSDMLGFLTLRSQLKVIHCLSQEDKEELYHKVAYYVGLVSRLSGIQQDPINSHE
eukprot:scaffold4504_cov128-Cylindrotheca_fusiformis.AAC.2